MKNCRDCCHFAREPGADTAGECRRKAPRLAPDGSPWAQHDGAPYAYWPIVAASSWCGEFRASVRARA